MNENEMEYIRNSPDVTTITVPTKNCKQPGVVPLSKASQTLRHFDALTSEARDASDFSATLEVSERTPTVAATRKEDDDGPVAPNDTALGTPKL